MQEKDQKYWSLKASADRNEKILKKHVDENQTLKRQVGSGGGASSVPRGPAAGEALPQKRDFKTMRAQRKENATKSIEEFNQKFLTDLSLQIDDMFTNVANRKAEKAQPGEEESEDSVPKDTEEGETVAKDEESKAEGATVDTTTTTVDKEVEEKAQILEGVRKMALGMQSDIKDLLKNEWAGSINSLESEKKKAESDRQESLKKAKDDSKAIQSIEKEHRTKMESLNNQVTKLEREKQKKEESV